MNAGRQASSGRAAQLIGRAQDEARRGAFADAKRSCERALQQAPTSLAALRLHAMLLTQLGQTSAAIGAFRRVLDRDPADVESMANLAGLLGEQGERDGSIALLERAIHLRPHWPALHFNLGNELSAATRLEAALQSYAAVLRLEPGFAAAHNNRGSALKRLGRLAEAIDSFQAAVRTAPEWPVARTNLGAALLDAGQFAAAIAESWRACELDAGDQHGLASLSEALLRPGVLTDYLQKFRDPAAGSFKNERIWDAVAALYLDGRRLPAAAIIWATVLERSETAVRWANLGLATLLQGYETATKAALEVAVHAFHRALSLDPSHSMSRIHLASALKDVGRGDEAMGVLEPLAPFKDPGQALGAATLLELKAGQWDWSDYRELLLTVSGAVRQHAQGLPPMGIVVRFDDLELQRTATLQYLSGLGILAAPRGSAPPVESPRLRVGYLSADFRDHPVAHALAAVIEAHDRSKVEIIGIATTPGDESPISKRIRAAFDRCVDASARDIDAQEALIRGLHLDMIVDLGGLTVGNNPRLLARRPAPIQAAYLGYAGTTGPAGIDYLIADRCVIPPESAGHYDERVVWLPDTFLPGEPLALPEMLEATRASEGLPENAFVFCNFNQPVRLNPHAFDTFLAILGRVPQSVLWLRSPGPSAEARLREYAAQKGFDTTRVVFASRTQARGEYFDRLRLADLFLDTLPYNAHTTGREALAAGLPLLTCAGNSFAARVAASVLTSLGLQELVTERREDFIERAAELAHAPGRLEALKGRLAEARSSSAAFQPKIQARQLEAAFGAMARHSRTAGGKQPIDLAEELGRSDALHFSGLALPLRPPAAGPQQESPAPSRNIIWLASYPKSGNTWLRFLVCNLIHGPQHSAAALDELAPDIHELGAHYSPPAGPVLLKTHFPYGPRLPFAERTAAAICIVRHPGDVMLSNYHYAQRSAGAAAAGDPALEDFAARYLGAGGDARWLERGMGRWQDNVGSWFQRNHPFPVLQIRYEDLLADTRAGAERICEFLNLSRTSIEIAAAAAGTAFERLSVIEDADIAQGRVGIFYKPYLRESIARGRRFMRAGRAGDSLKELSTAQLNALQDVFGPTMRALGYE